MRKHKGFSKNRSGSALIMVVFVAIMLFVMGSSMLAMSLNSFTLSTRTANNFSAQAAADSGIVQALFELNKKVKTQTWDDNNLPSGNSLSIPNSDAVYSYSVTGDNSSGFEIESIGAAGNCQKTVVCQILIEGDVDYTLFADEYIKINDSCVIDWYNFGGISATPKIGTNATQSESIYLNNNCTINGDVDVGVGGKPSNVVKLNSASINGEIGVMTAPYELESVVIPGSLSSLSNKGDMTSSKTLYGDAKYTKVDLGGNQKLTIRGKVSLYVKEVVSISNQSKIVVDTDWDPDSSLTLYIGKEFKINDSSSVNSLSADPSKCKINCLDSCSVIDLNNSSVVYGQIYAPETEVKVNDATGIYGTVACNTFEQNDGGNLYGYAGSSGGNANNPDSEFLVHRWEDK